MSITTSEKSSFCASFITDKKRNNLHFPHSTYTKSIRPLITQSFVIVQPFAFKKRLVFVFRPFVRKADTDKTQKLLPQVSFAISREYKVRCNQHAVIFQDAADFRKRLRGLRDNVERIRNYDNIKGVIHKT